MTAHVSPRLVEHLAERERIRRLMERAVEKLIAALDEMSGDADFEPTLGAPEHHPGRWSAGKPDQRLWAAGVKDDREEDAGDEGELENEHGAEDDRGEPSLGSIGSCCGGWCAPQTLWASGGTLDCEVDVHDEPHDAEPDEPSLASRTAVWDQRRGWSDATNRWVDAEASHD